MGAEPFAYFLNLSLPADLGDDWLRIFASGLQADQKQYGLNLLGGDTTRTPGPLALSVTIFGEVPTGCAVRRSTAQSGDAVFVSGTIGDAGLGLQRLRDGAGAEDPLVQRYQLPEPRVALGNALRALASAMADVSDGLLADLGHICTASGVGATLDATAIPVSEAARAALGDAPEAYSTLLTSGDDYELVFTVSPDRIDAAREVAQATGTRITQIGRMEDGAAVVTVRAGDGSDITPQKTGYRHF
ncbi:unnamed protein product [Laminaria digitata]